MKNYWVIKSCIAVAALASIAGPTQAATAQPSAAASPQAISSSDIATRASRLPTCESVFYYQGSRRLGIPIASAGSPNCIMAQGARSEAVKRLQIALNVCNAQRLQEDGIYGPATAGAVRNVQSAGLITVDGEYGPNTRSKMRFPSSGGCVWF